MRGRLGPSPHPRQATRVATLRVPPGPGYGSGARGRAAAQRNGVPLGTPSPTETVALAATACGPANNSGERDPNCNRSPGMLAGGVQDRADPGDTTKYDSTNGADVA